MPVHDAAGAVGGFDVHVVRPFPGGDDDQDVLAFRVLQRLFQPLGVLWAGYQVLVCQGDDVRPVFHGVADGEGDVLAVRLASLGIGAEAHQLGEVGDAVRPDAVAPFADGDAGAHHLAEAGGGEEVVVAVVRVVDVRDVIADYPLADV